MNLGERSFSFTQGFEFVKVGNYSSIAEGCFFHSPDNHYCVENKKYVSTFNFKQAKSRGDTEIGNDVWIGRGAIVLDGVRIGDGSIIGAHTVVTKDVPPFSVVAGNPGRVVRTRFSSEQIKALNEIRWWDWGENTINNVVNSGHFEDIDQFIEIYSNK